ncbi:MAG TPA: hypothetical protein VF129_14275 [Actinomycetota bacterium]
MMQFVLRRRREGKPLWTVFFKGDTVGVVVVVIATAALQWTNAVAGLALIASSVPRGSIRQRYGSADRVVI